MAQQFGLILSIIVVEIGRFFDFVGNEKIPLNSAIISFVVVLTNLPVSQQDEAYEIIIKTISSLPHISENNMEVYHNHTVFAQDLYCKKEYYVEIRLQSIFFAGIKVSDLKNGLGEELEKQFDKDVLIQIKRIQWQVDWSVIRVIVVIIPIVCLLIVCICVTIVWKRKQKEKKDTILLLS